MEDLALRKGANVADKKIGLLGLAATSLALLFVARPGKAQQLSALERGKAYRAVFSVPESLKVHTAELARVMPEGSDLVLDGSRLQVRFIALSTKPIGDVSTPLGTLELLSLQEIG